VNQPLMCQLASFPVPPYVSDDPIMQIIAFFVGSKP
jgi:hypothetical protein